MWNTLRSALGPWGIVPFGDHMPDNSLGDMNALAKAHADARAQRLAAGPSGSLMGPPAPPAPSPPISGISPGYQDTPSIKGLINSGNIDIHKRPIVRNPDGTISTVRSLSANFGNGEVLMPTVSDDGRVMSDKEAMDTYRKTGRHLGVFDTPDNATAYAKSLHEDQAKEYGAKAPQMPWWASGDMTKMFPGAAPPAPSPAPAPAPVSAPQSAPVPMPQAGPADAPQAPPDTSFFMRNAMMQHDPITGQMLDPGAASSVSGPDLISKMMTYLHGKA